MLLNRTLTDDVDQLINEGRFVDEPLAPNAVDSLHIIFYLSVPVSIKYKSKYIYNDTVKSITP